MIFGRIVSVGRAWLRTPRKSLRPARPDDRLHGQRPAARSAERALMKKHHKHGACECTCRQPHVTGSAFASRKRPVSTGPNVAFFHLVMDASNATFSALAASAGAGPPRPERGDRDGTTSRPEWYRDSPFRSPRTRGPDARFDPHRDGMDCGRCGRWTWASLADARARGFRATLPERSP